MLADVLSTERQHILVHHIEELTTLNVRGRIQNELSRLCRDTTNSNGSAVIFPVPTHDDLPAVSEPSAKPFHANLVIFSKRGVILRHDGALFVQDIARLMEAQIKLKD